MGWTGTTAYKYKKGQIDRQAECLDLFNGDKIEVLKSSMVGTVFYAAVRNKTSGEVFGVVVLTKVDGNTIYTKVITDDMCPGESKCPVGILKLLTAPSNEYAAKWRANCYAYHESKRASKDKPSLDKLPAGTKIKVVTDRELVWNGTTIATGTVLTFVKYMIEDKGVWILAGTYCRLSKAMIQRMGYEVIN